MTYCVAVAVKSGIIFCSDSRTNAGVDQVSTYSKMHQFERAGERQIIILTSGNLATTQSVIHQLKKDIDDNLPTTLLSVQNLDDAASYLGQVSLMQQQRYAQAGGVHEASFLIGGQIAGKEPRVLMVYPQGNYITTSKDTPFLQIGESKYGKPILDRIIDPDTSLETATLCALVSMDSTMRSNLTVGPPIEVAIYETNSFNLNRRYRLEQDSDYLRDLKRAWDERLKDAFRSLPPLQWANMWDKDKGQGNTSGGNF